MPEDPDSVKRRSTLAIRLFLKEFCVEFLHGAYNNLMSVVRDNVVSFYKVQSWEKKLKTPRKLLLRNSILLSKLL